MKKETPKESEQPNKELQARKVLPEFQELLDAGVIRDLGDRWEYNLQNQLQSPTAIDKAKLYFPKQYYNGDFMDIVAQGEWNLRDWQSYNLLIQKSCFQTDVSLSRGVDIGQIRRMHADDMANCFILVQEVITNSAPKLVRRILSR